MFNHLNNIQNNHLVMSPAAALGLLDIQSLPWSYKDCSVEIHPDGLNKEEVGNFIWVRHCLNQYQS